jgi:hypothetical protein
VDGKPTIVAPQGLVNEPVYKLATMVTIRWLHELGRDKDVRKNGIDSLVGHQSGETAVADAHWVGKLWRNRRGLLTTVCAERLETRVTMPFSALQLLLTAGARVGIYKLWGNRIMSKAHLTKALPLYIFSLFFFFFFFFNICF